MRKSAKLAILIIVTVTTTILTSCVGMKCHQNMARDECYNKCQKGLYSSAQYNETTGECCCISEW